jgi:hypothetical protein
MVAEPAGVTELECLRFSGAAGQVSSASGAESQRSPSGKAAKIWT